MPTANERKEYADAFIDTAIGLAEWHAGKAEEFPRESRHLDSEAALRGLANGLEKVSPHDSRWTCLWLAEHGLRDDDDYDHGMVSKKLHEKKTDLLREYGFERGEPATPTTLEVFGFMDSAIKALEDCAELAARPSSSSGKAVVFDSLEEALAWFRPGALTNGLFRQLGGQGAEFIE